MLLNIWLTYCTHVYTCCLDMVDPTVGRFLHNLYNYILEQSKHRAFHCGSAMATMRVDPRPTAPWSCVDGRKHCLTLCEVIVGRELPKL